MDPSGVDASALFSRMQTIVTSLRQSSGIVSTIHTHCEALRAANLKDQKQKFHAVLGIVDQLKQDGTDLY